VADHVGKQETAMRLVNLLILPFVAGTAIAKLPPPTEEAKALAVENAAKGAWTDKVAQYQLCKAMDRTADAYRASLRSSGKDAPAAIATAPCTDPGPYVSPVAAARPLEAAGAHSPPETVVSAPNVKQTSAELGGSK